MMVFMPLVVVWIDQFCRGDWSSKHESCSYWLDVVLLQFSIHLLFVEVCQFGLRSCVSHL